MWLFLLSFAHAAPLSLADALRAALVANPDLVASTYTLDEADASVTSARGVFDPTLDAGVSADGAETSSYLAGYPTSSSTVSWEGDVDLGGQLGSGTSWSVGAATTQQSSSTVSTLGGQSSTSDTDTWATTLSVTASQDLLALLRPTDARAALRKAVERADQASVQALDTRAQVLSDVATAWWDWSGALEQVDVATRSVTAAKALEARTAAWVEVGQSQAVELARVKADRLQAEETLAKAQAAAGSAADVLLLRIGAPPGTPIEPAGDPVGPTLPTLSLDAHLAAAAAASPTVLLARLQADAATAAARDTRYDALPSLSLGASAGVSTLEDTAGASWSGLFGDGALPSWGVGLDLSVPLGGRAARGAQDGATAQKEAAIRSLESAERTVDANVRAALRDEATAEQSLALAEARLQVAKETEAGEGARVNEGTRRMDQLLDAVHDREDAELDVIAARRELWRATLQVARLEGTVEAALSVPHE